MEISRLHAKFAACDATEAYRIRGARIAKRLKPLDRQSPFYLRITCENTMCSLKEKENKGDIDNIRSQPRIENSKRRTREMCLITFPTLFFLFLVSTPTTCSLQLALVILRRDPEDSKNPRYPRYFACREEPIERAICAAHRSAARNEKKDL